MRAKRLTSRGSWWRRVALTCVSASWVLAACTGAPTVEVPPELGTKPAATPTPPPTEEPPPRELTICLAQEPTTLYLYGDTNRATDVVLAAIYDGPFDVLGFRPEPVILEETPTIASGDVVVEPVPITFGDVYVNPLTLEPEILRRGSPVLPSGCSSPECIEDFSGEEVLVDRMRVHYQLRPGLVWSDGEPLTAADSVFSHELDGDPATLTPKYLFARTFRYEALDDLTVEWVGLPGFLDNEVSSSFWTPLPEHILGELDAVQLQNAPEAYEKPLGWGPYRIEAWERGKHILLSPNPNYQGGSSPAAFERLTFRFVEGTAAALDSLRSGDCDILDEDLLPLDRMSEIQAARSDPDTQVLGSPGFIVERLEFNLEPPAGSEGTSVFADVRTRQGLAACIDREGLARTLFGEQAVVSDSFLPSAHPDYAQNPVGLVADPEQGAALLSEAGWSESETGDGVRRAREVKGVDPSTPLAFELSHLDSSLAERVAQAVAEDLSQCGARVEIKSFSLQDFYQTYPEGAVFGRDFSMVLWGWPVFDSPACEMFASWEVPSEGTPLGINASGYEDAEYDEACRALIWTAPGSEERGEAAGAAQVMVREDLPALPLFVRPRYVAHADWICGLELDESASTVLWNLESVAPCR